MITRPMSQRQVPPVPSPRAATAEDRKWEDKAKELQNELQYETLARIQSTADKWAQSVAVIIGLFTLAAAVKGPQDISSLAPMTQKQIVALIIVTLFSALAALLAAAFAAQGIPRKQWISGPALRRAYESGVDRSLSLLNTSRICMGVAVVTLLSALALTWLSPKQPPQAMVIEKSGVALCGLLQTNAKGELVLTTLQSGGSSLILVDVVSITPVTDCP